MRPVVALVTGVGYIGAQLVRDLLDQGEEVVGLENFFSTRPGQLEALRTHPRFTLLQGSIANPRALRTALERASPRVVYHLAGQSSAHPDAASVHYLERSNLVGPRLLFEALRDRGVEVVVLGSSFRVLGDELPPVVDEAQPYGRVGDLSHLSKIYLEKLAEMLAYQGGPRVVSARLGISYGLSPVMKDDPRFQTAPNRFCAQAAAGERLRVLATRPAGFIHVRDAARALRLAAELPATTPYRVVNAAAEVLTVGEVAQLVRAIGQQRGLAVEIEGEVAASPQRFEVRSTLTNHGFQPQHSMPEALPEVLDFFLARRGAGARAQ